ncbi:MAG: BrnA antitoxin family protein [Sulfuritalea sp.]|nr:BrnA antitoxin family protein [Sulfuritalea sp.]
MNGGGSRQSAAYVFDVLAVLTVVPVARDDPLRIVSFRPERKEPRPPRPRRATRRDRLAAFRAAGPGWQTRMNAALRDWLKNHSPA